MIRVIVNDQPGTEHAIGVRAAVIAGYNCLADKLKYPDIDISDQVEIMAGSFGQIVEYSKLDRNIVAIARSTSGIRYMVDAAKTVYPRVQCFIPMGSNTFYDMKIFTDPVPPVIMTCGCGDDESRNNTGYGNGLEFWDMDWTWVGGQDASSFSNGWICGKMLRLYDEIRKSRIVSDWWEPRYLMRQGCWRLEPNRAAEPWDIKNGYGRPNLDEGLRLIDTMFIPEDPYYMGLVLGEVGILSGVPLGSVKIFIEPVKNALLYKIKRNGEVIKQIKAGEVELSLIDNLEMYGTYIYSYYVIGIFGESKESNKISVNYQKGYHPRIIQLIQNLTDVVSE